jgi:hypothetical protein
MRVGAPGPSISLREDIGARATEGKASGWGTPADTKACQSSRAGKDKDHGQDLLGGVLGGIGGAALGAGLGFLVGGPAGAVAGGLLAGGLGAYLGSKIGGGAAPTKTKSVFAVSLPGSSRSPSADVARANTIWSQCGLGVTLAGTESWKTNLLDQQNPPGVLNEYSDPANPTLEELTMVPHQPGGSGVIHAFYVPAMSAGSRGEAFMPSITPTLPAAAVISDSAAVDSLAHELGHVWLNEAGHSADPDSLMASGSIRNVGVDKLDPTQCAKI